MERSVRSWRDILERRRTDRHRGLRQRPALLMGVLPDTEIAKDMIL